MDYATQEEEEKGVRGREREEHSWMARKTCGEAADWTDLSSLI